MKKLWLTGGLLVVGTALLLAFNAGASAHFSNNDNNNTVEKTQTIDGAWYAAGKTVAIDGEVKGSVYCAAQKVVITGVVDGDVFCAAQKIAFSGDAKVVGSVRLAAQDVALKDKTAIAGDVTVFSQTITVGENASIDRDFSGAAQDVTIDGEVKRDLAIATDSATINGTVQRDADLAFDTSINFGDEASIVGNLSYTSKTEKSIPEGVVKGKTSWHEAKSSAATDRQRSTKSIILSGVITLVFALLVALIFPKFVDSASKASDKKFGTLLGVGVLMTLGLVALPIIGVILMATTIGLYAGIALLLLWGLWLLIMFPLASYYLGRLVLKVYQKDSNIVLNMLAGAVLVLLLLQIPFIQGVAAVGVMVFGSGLLALWIGRNFNHPSYATKQVVAKRQAKKPASKKK